MNLLICKYKYIYICEGYMALLSSNYSDELNAQLENYKEIFGPIPCSALIINEAHNIVYANFVALKILKYEEKDILNQPANAIGIAKEAIEQLLLDKKPAKIILKNSEDEKLTFQISASKLAGAEFIVLTFNSSPEDKSPLPAEMLQRIIDEAPISIHAHDIDGKLIFFNKVSGTIFDIEDRGDESFYRGREKYFFDQNKSMNLEEEYVDKNGKKMILHTLKKPFYKENGEPYFILTMVEDITEKREYLRETLRSQAFLQKVVDNLPAALSVKNVTGEYILWNKKSEQLYNVKSADIIGKKYINNHIAKEQKEYIASQDKAVFDSKTELKIPQEIISTSEGVRIMETSKMPVYQASGAPDYILTISEDITQRIRTDRQLKESNEKFSLLIENAQEGLAILENRKIIFANRKLANLLGLDNVELVASRNIFDFVADKSKQEFERQYELSLTSQGTTPLSEVTFIAETGEEKTVDIFGSTSRYLGKKIVLLFFQDKKNKQPALAPAPAQNAAPKPEKDTFARVFENMPESAFIMNAYGRTAMLNAACRAIFNLKREDAALYKSFYLRPLLPLAARRAVANGAEAEADITFNPALYKDAGLNLGFTEKKNFHLRFVPLSKEEYLVYITDGSAAPAPQDAQTAAEAAFFSGQDILTMNEPIVKCNSHGKVIFATEAFLNMAGLDELPENGRSIFSFFPEKDKDALQKDLRELYKTFALNQRAHTLKIKEGKLLDIEISAVRTKDNGFVALFKNAAVKKQFLNIIANSLAMQGAYQTAMQGAALLCEADELLPSKIISANQEACDLLGYTAQALLEMPLAAVFTDPGASSKDAAEDTLKNKYKDVAAGLRAAYSASVYTQTGTELPCETVLCGVNLNNQNYVLVYLRDISATLCAGARNSKESKELEGLKNIVPGVLLSLDYHGNVLDVHTKNPAYALSENPAEYINKKLGEFLPKDVADNMIYSIKEALSVNIPTEYKFRIKGKSGDKYYSVLFTPVGEEKRVLALAKEVTKELETENKIKKLYNLSSRASSSITQQVDDILTFGKHIFNAQAGIVLRFSNDTKNHFTVVYASENDMNVKRSMMFPVDAFFTKTVSGDNVLSTDVQALELERSSLLKMKNIKSAIAAPLYLGEKISGALVFVSRESRAAYSGADEDFIGLMSKLLSLSIELRQTDKLVLKNEANLQSALAHVKTPAVMLSPKYETLYKNDAFKAAAASAGEAYEKDFFALYASGADYSRRLFFAAANNSPSDDFSVRFPLKQHAAKEVNFGWKVRKIKNSSGDITSYVLVAE